MAGRNPFEPEPDTSDIPELGKEFFDKAKLKKFVSFDEFTEKVGEITNVKLSEAKVFLTNSEYKGDNVVRTAFPAAHKLERTEALNGTTYKLKPAGAEHALYVTINDIEEERGDRLVMRPFEIFFNSKQVEGWPWMTALSRMISAVFRKGGDSTFIVEELKAVFDPRGGFWQPGRNGEKGHQVPSIIAGIGEIIEQHMKAIGYIETDETQAEFESGIEEVRDATSGETYQAFVQYCPKCNGHLHKREGCMCCTRCDYTKC